MITVTGAIWRPCQYGVCALLCLWTISKGFPFFEQCHRVWSHVTKCVTDFISFLTVAKNLIRCPQGDPGKVWPVAHSRKTNSYKKILIPWTPRCQTEPCQLLGFMTNFLNILLVCKPLSVYTHSQSPQTPFGHRGAKQRPVKLLGSKTNFLKILLVCKPLNNF